MKSIIHNIYFFQYIDKNLKGRILNNNEISKLKLINSPRQRRQKLDTKLPSVLTYIEVIKFIRSVSTGTVSNFYSVMSLLLRMCVKWKSAMRQLV